MNVLQAALGRPGRYRVTATYTNRVGEPRKDGDRVEVGVWIGSVTSPAVELEVVP